MEDYIKNFKNAVANSFEQKNKEYKTMDLDKLGKFTLKSGKFKGRTFEESLKNNTEYCTWIYTNRATIQGSLKTFIIYLERLLY